METNNLPEPELSNGAAPGAVGYKKYLWPVGAAVVVGVLIGAAASRWTGGAKPAGTARQQTSYQSVFLTNGQVYFGKVLDDTQDPVVLHDVYYLQVTQQLQPAPNPSTSPQNVPQISLIKLGNELHGPTDEMRITRSQILFIEDLKDSSAVVKAITSYGK